VCADDDRDLTGNLQTIRQFAMVRKFRSAALQVRGKHPGKKGKQGIVVKPRKKSLMHLHRKLQGGEGSLGEIVEDHRSELIAEAEAEMEEEDDLEESGSEYTSSKGMPSGKIRLSPKESAQDVLRRKVSLSMEMNLKNQQQQQMFRMSDDGSSDGGSAIGAADSDNIGRSKSVTTSISPFSGAGAGSGASGANAFSLGAIVDNGEYDDGDGDAEAEAEDSPVPALKIKPGSPALTRSSSPRTLPLQRKNSSKPNSPPFTQPPSPRGQAQPPFQHTLQHKNSFQMVGSVVHTLVRTLSSTGSQQPKVHVHGENADPEPPSSDTAIGGSSGVGAVESGIGSGKLKGRRKSSHNIPKIDVIDTGGNTDLGTDIDADADADTGSGAGIESYTPRRKSRGGEWPDEIKETAPVRRHPSAPRMGTEPRKNSDKVPLNGYTAPSPR
jgi:hypothetical protein